MVVLQKFHHNPNEIQAGVDEAGRGCLIFGVTAAAVVWDPECQDPRQELIKDSKKLSPKKRKEARQFIEENALAYSVYTVDQNVIDDINILNATYQAMHKALDGLNRQIDRILVDGDRFRPYLDPSGEYVPHHCVVEGDNTYLSIAAASVLAKTYRDEFVEKKVIENPELDRYKLSKNKGYGTKDHIDAIRKYGITNYHRKSFGIVKDYV
jgi:ribonuclease HII